MLLVDFEINATGLRKLYADAVYHIIFPSDYFPLDQSVNAHWANLILQNHPTWKSSETSAHKMRFGGYSQGNCGCCNGELHHLITLGPIPVNLKTQFRITCYRLEEKGISWQTYLLPEGENHENPSRIVLGKEDSVRV